MFITIEDESGIANLVVWPRIFETQRRIILAAGMLAVYGPIQREGDVVHLVAHRLKALGKHRAPPGAPAPAPRPPPRPTIRKDPHPARGYGQNWPPECRCYRPHARLPPGLPGPRNIPAAEIPGTGELLGCPAPLVRRPWIRFQRWRAVGGPPTGKRAGDSPTPSPGHARCFNGACLGSAGVRSRSGHHLPLRFRPGFWFGGRGEMGMKPGATPQAREAGWRACVALADARAAALAPVISEIRSSGMTSPVCIAAALSARGIPTARGHRVWENGPVRQLLNRVDRLAAAGALDPEIVATAQETER
jgi:hypothetical protein